MKIFNNLVSWILVIISAIIAFAWLDQNIKLIELFSYGPSIKFITAIWFLIVGVSFLCRDKHPRIAYVLGIILLVWSFLSFASTYVYPYSLISSDVLLISGQYSLLQVPAPNTCISFILIGIILLISHYPSNVILVFINLLSSFVVLSLGLVAIIGYALSISTAYGWSEQTQMALVSSVGLFLIGIIFTWRLYDSAPKDKKIIYLPIASFIYICIFSSFLSFAVYQLEKIKILLVLNDHINQNAENVSNSLNQLQAAFIRFKARVENSSNIPDPFWKRDADSYINNIPELDAIALLQQNNIKILSNDSKQSPELSKKYVFNCKKLIDNKLINHVILSDTHSLCITAKIENNKNFDLLVFILNFKPYQKTLEIHDLNKWHSMGMLSKNNYLFISNNNKISAKDNMEIRKPVIFQNLELYLTGTPSKELIRELGSNLPFYLYIFSLVFAALWSFLILYILKEKHHQNMINKLNQQLQLILDSSHVSIIATDTHGLITHFNRAAEQMLEYSADEMIGHATPMLFHDYAEIRKQANKLTAVLGRTIQPNFETFTAELEKVNNAEHEWTYISKSGKKIPILLSVTAMYDQHHKVDGYLGIGFDISERKEVEQVKNEFISMVSHELRTPLTSIHGSLIILLEQVVGVQTTESLELLSIALNNTDRLIRLINDILDLDKIESGRMKFNYKIYSVNELIQQSILLNQGYAQKFSVELSSRLLNEDVTIEVDHDRMIQVLTNLISNAIKFSPQNEIVEIIATKEKERVTIAVTDKGNGIPLKFQKNIFHKFSQADSSPIRKQQGTGLGLSISKLIVETMGGTISFDTEENVGTSFKLNFAIHNEKDDINVSSDDKEIRKNILHIEDDADLYKVINKMLNKKYHIDHVNSMVAARKFLEKKHYHLVILDLKLQDGVSYELLPFLHDLNIPVIILSAYELPNEYEQYIKEYLIKSKVSNEEIMLAIDKVMKGN